MFAEFVLLKSLLLWFLSSLVGSWGPVFYPMMWHAFRAWVYFLMEHDADHKPIILGEEMITNYFFKMNPNIWTPYFIE